MNMMEVRLKVNEEEVKVLVKPHETLLYTLRERLYLTGAKEGCGLGACGSCTVLIDGKPVRSCLVLTPEVEGKEIITIEGLKKNDGLHIVQRKFVEHGAVQCGFCTSGMILTAVYLLEKEDKINREKIVRTISSNVCRCTGYKKIIEAIENAAKEVGKWSY